MQMIGWTTRAACVVAAALVVQPARAAGVEDFYKGKTVSIVIGYSVGGGYDAYGRLLARHLGKYIPGQPSVVPQNMTGAGSLKAANYIYSVAPKDGLAIGTFSRSLAIAPLLNKAEFDSTRFTWLGSVTDEVSLCVTRQDSAVKTFNDLLVMPSTFGGEGAGSDPNVFALALSQRVRRQDQAGERLSRAPTRSSSRPSAARSTGCADCPGARSKAAIRIGSRSARPISWCRPGSRKKPSCPTCRPPPISPRSRSSVRSSTLILIGQAMARPFAAPPGIPADRKAALIAAFDRTVQGSGLSRRGAAAQRRRQSGAAARLDALLAEAYATPKDVIARAAKALSD